MVNSCSVLAHAHACKYACRALCCFSSYPDRRSVLIPCRQILDGICRPSCTAKDAAHPSHPPASAPYRRSALILYRQILDGIEKNGFNNFTQRAYVPKLRKFARCAACAALHCAAPGLHVCVLAWVRGVAGWPSWSGGGWALSVVVFVEAGARS